MYQIKKTQIDIFVCFSRLPKRICCELQVLDVNNRKVDALEIGWTCGLSNKKLQMEQEKIKNSASSVFPSR